MEKPLCFVHTPKCGGTSVNHLLNNMGIELNGHKRPQDNNKAYFTIVRHPVDRFISLLNNRLQELQPRADFPQRLHYAHYNNTSLNEIIENLTNKEMLSFRPSQTLEFWTEGCQHVITINQLQPFLATFGYTFDMADLKRLNVSKKTRGEVDMGIKGSISAVFIKDLQIYLKALENKF